MKLSGLLFIYFWGKSGFGQILSIRDDLFDTFHKRNREGHELSDVKITADSLHRLDLEFAFLDMFVLSGSICKKFLPCDTPVFFKVHIELFYFILGYHLFMQLSFDHANSISRVFQLEIGFVCMFSGC